MPSNGGVEAIEPLEPNIWFERFSTIRDRAGRPEARLPGQVLRQVYHSLQLCPGPLKHLFIPPIDEAGFERFLDCDAYESAALALAGPAIDYTITRNAGDGTVTVDIACADHRAASSETAPDLATAFVLAYCACMMALFESASARVNELLRQTGQSGLHPLQSVPRAFSSYLRDEPQRSAD